MRVFRFFEGRLGMDLPEGFRFGHVSARVAQGIMTREKRTNSSLPLEEKVARPVSRKGRDG